jgi:hypothetical protein
MDLAEELQRIYDSEIKVRISWLRDGGIEVRLGDEVNGNNLRINTPTASRCAWWSSIPTIPPTSARTILLRYMGGFEPPILPAALATPGEVTLTALDG